MDKSRDAFLKEFDTELLYKSQEEFMTKHQVGISKECQPKMFQAEFRIEFLLDSSEDFLEKTCQEFSYKSLLDSTEKLLEKFFEKFLK